MKNVCRMVRADIRFQYMHGFYYAYLFMVIVYVFLLYAVPIRYLEPATVMIIFIDPTLLGAFFVGGIVLLEKSQGVYGPLFITSLQVKEFILAKVISLSIISVLSSFAILIFVHKIDFHFLPVFSGVLLSSIIFTLIGLLLALRVHSVNQFLLTSPLVITIFFIPIAIIFDWWDSPFLMLLPSYAGIMLLEGAFRTLLWKEVLYAGTTLLVWCYFLYRIAEQSFIHQVLRKGDGGK